MPSVTRTMLAYLEQVEEFFLAQRGRGLMLSPDDTAFIRDLEARGVPPEVVCRGVARAFTAEREGAAPGAHAPRTLRACEGFIDTEIDAWRSKEVGRNTWSEGSELVRGAEQLARLLARIERLGKESPDPQRTYYRRAWRGVRDLWAAIEREPQKVARAAQALAEIESRALHDFFGQLAPIEQVHVKRDAEACVSLVRAEVSARAWDAAVLASLEAALRATYGLMPLRYSEADPP